MKLNSCPVCGFTPRIHKFGEYSKDGSTYIKTKYIMYCPNYSRRDHNKKFITKYYDSKDDAVKEWNSIVREFSKINKS